MQYSPVATLREDVAQALQAADIELLIGLPHSNDGATQEHDKSKEGEDAESTVEEEGRHDEHHQGCELDNREAGRNRQLH